MAFSVLTEFFAELRESRALPAAGVVRAFGGRVLLYFMALH